MMPLLIEAWGTQEKVNNRYPMNQRGFIRKSENNPFVEISALEWIFYERVPGKNAIRKELIVMLQEPCLLAKGHRVEAYTLWPSKLEEGEALKLMAWGRIIAREQDVLVIAVKRAEFRTRAKRRVALAPTGS